MKIIILTYFIFQSFCLSSYAQKDGLIIEKINGVKYYIHSVEKGNTLYSISKKYGVSIDDITKNNPDVANGIRIGQTLKLPVNKANPDKSGTFSTDLQGDFLIHKVAEKETLYSISKKYNLKPKDIMAVNPETLSKDIHIGQELKVPILKSHDIKPKDIQPAINDSLINSKLRKDIDEKNIASPSSKTAIVLKNKYEVSFLLPFYTNINDSIEKNLKTYEMPYLYKESESALLFYEGALLALDSLKKTDANIHVQITDTKDDSIAVSEIFNQPELQKSDLIIGPFYQYLFEDAAVFAKKYNIGIVCPVPQSAKILLENKFASKVLASPLIQAEQLTEYCGRKYASKKLLLFSSNEKTDMKLSQAVLKKAEEISERNNISISISDYYFADINIEKIKILLQKTDTNIILIPSHNQVFVSDMLTKLNSITGGYNFIVFGLDKWTEYENIDIHYLHQLNVHIASPMYINYDSPAVLRLTKQFREKYKTEPGKFGFLGYDVTCHYLSALQKYGESFYDYLPDYKSDLFTLSFDFIKTGFDSGCENKHVFILKYDDYKLRQIE